MRRVSAHVAYHLEQEPGRRAATPVEAVAAFEESKAARGKALKVR